MNSRFTSLYVLILLLAGGLLTMNSVAQDDSSKDELRLNLDFGYRWRMGFRGSEDLYRSQIDLGQGPKLFAGDLFFAPAAGSNKLLDRLELNLNNWGGEPYNTARVRMAKNGIYDLDFNYQNVSFFNSIPTFANPLIEKGSLLSQHREDSSLRTASVELRLFPGAHWTPIFAYQRTSRFGNVNTTFSGDWDEFKLNKDLDFSSDDLRLGILYHRTNFSAQIEQGGRWYRDLSTFSSPGFQEGNSTRPFIGRDIYLDSYGANQDVKSRIIPYSTVRLTYTPVNTLLLQGRASYSQADFRSRLCGRRRRALCGCVRPSIAAVRDEHHGRQLFSRRECRPPTCQTVAAVRIQLPATALHGFLVGNSES